MAILLPPHGKNLRIGRHSEPGGIYLVTTCCERRQRFFEAIRLGDLVVDEIARSDAERGCRTLAFVVMPDHMHWLVELGATPLTNIVGRLKGRSAIRINRARGDKGAVWQAGFHDHALRTDEDLVAVAEYVIHNPVRAGLVARVADYPLWHSIWK